MNFSKRRFAAVWWLIFFALAAADSIVKLFIPRTFRNYGFVFSIPLPPWSIYLVYGIVLVPLVVYYVKRRTEFSHWESISWLLIFSGSASNILERIRLGYVRDFIYLPGGGVINIADILITLGLVMILAQRRKK
jgi:lipoprotein signal peptidase